MTKILIEIQEQLYDMWEFRSLERGERYNDEREELDYLLLMNRKAVAVNYQEVEFVYPTVEARDADYKKIREQLEFTESVVIIDAGMSLKDIKKIIDAKLGTTPPKDENY